MMLYEGYCITTVPDMTNGWYGEKVAAKVIMLGFGYFVWGVWRYAGKVFDDDDLRPEDCMISDKVRVDNDLRLHIAFNGIGFARRFI